MAERQPNDPLRSIHVGVGRRGEWPIELCAADSDWQPVALADLDEELLASAREVTGLPAGRCFRGLEEALTRVGGEADAVIICAPTRFHAPLARQAFAAGKHVLVEKGMTTSLAEARALVREAEARGVAFCVAQNYRYQPLHLELKRRLEASELGAVAFVDLIHHRYRPDPRTLDYPGAMVWDMSCHHFDLLVFLFGRVLRAQASTYSAPWSRYPHDAGVSAVLELDGGIVVNYCLTHQAPNNYYLFQLHAARGTLQVGRGLEFRPVASREAQQLEVPDTGRSEQHVLDAFRRYIHEGQEPGISGRHNLQVMAACQAVLDAAAQRREIDVQALLERD